MKRREFVVYSGAGLLATAVPAAVGKVAKPLSVGNMAAKVGDTFVCTDANGVQHSLRLSAVHEHNGGPQLEQFTLQFQSASNTQLDGLYWVEAKGERGEMLALQSGLKGQTSASFSRLIG